MVNPLWLTSKGNRLGRSDHEGATYRAMELSLGQLTLKAGKLCSDPFFMSCLGGSYVRCVVREADESFAES